MAFQKEIYGLPLIMLPKKIALKNSLLVPNQVPLKFGLSTKEITFPRP
jgi:hypothetical protein